MCFHYTSVKVDGTDSCMLVIQENDYTNASVFFVEVTLVMDQERSTKRENKQTTETHFCGVS